LTNTLCHAELSRVTSDTGDGGFRFLVFVHCTITLNVSGPYQTHKRLASSYMLTVCIILHRNIRNKDTKNEFLALRPFTEHIPTY